MVFPCKGETNEYNLLGIVSHFCVCITTIKLLQFYASFRLFSETLLTGKTFIDRSDEVFDENVERKIIEKVWRLTIRQIRLKRFIVVNVRKYQHLQMLVSIFTLQKTRARRKQRAPVGVNFVFKFLIDINPCD